MTTAIQTTETAHGLKVGEVLCVSGGYDQTYYQFFQVVEVRARTKVVLQELELETVRDVAWAVREIRPMLNNFRGKPLTATFLKENSGWFKSLGKLFCRANLNRTYTETSYG